MMIRLLFLLFLSLTGARAASQRKIIALDDSIEVDELGWNAAHHVAYGNPVTIGESWSVTRPTERRRFLKSVSDDLLCQRNHFGQIPLHLAV